MRKDFEQKKELLIQKIEYYCKNQKTLEFNYDVLLDNIQQICKECAVSHAINDESKDMKYIDVPVLFEADRFVSQFRNQTIQIQ